MQYVDESPVDTLLLKVYPGSSSSYTLLEDNGTTFDYENGAIAKTSFKCKREGNKINLEISKREGK